MTEPLFTDQGIDWRLHVFVPGTPRPQGSKKVMNGRLVEVSRHVGPWRKTVAWTARAAYQHPVIERTVPVATWLAFVMPRPAATPKRKATPPAIKRPDVDKLARAVNDALTGVVWTDDSQVVWTVNSKRLAEPGEPPGVAVHAGICFPVWPNCLPEGVREPELSRAFPRTHPPATLSGNRGSSRQR